MFIQSEGLKFLFGIGKFALEQLLKNIVRGSFIIFMQTLQKIISGLSIYPQKSSSIYFRWPISLKSSAESDSTSKACFFAWLPMCAVSCFSLSTTNFETPINLVHEQWSPEELILFFVLNSPKQNPRVWFVSNNLNWLIFLVLYDMPLESASLPR